MTDGNSTCEDCVFYSEPRKAHSECRRYPPTKNTDAEKYLKYCSFPRVDLDSWCGEFHPRLDSMEDIEAALEKEEHREG